MGCCYSHNFHINWEVPDNMKIPEDKRVCHEEVEKLKSHVDKFNFENLVLSGGGAKGQAYCGVVQVRY